MRGIVVPCVCALVLVLAVPAASQQVADFSGRVFDADSKRGIENLEVKLTPPRGAKLSIRVANTNGSGAFLFSKLARGRYMVEVSQGVNLLYRAEVDTTQTGRLDIPLRRKR